MTDTPSHIITVPDSAGGAEHAVTVWDAGAAEFAARLRKVAKERRKWAARNGIACYRLYDADLPNYALGIDVYGAVDDEGTATGVAYVHVAEYEAPAEIDETRATRRLEDALAVIPPALGVPADRVFVKTRRRAKGGEQYALNREERRAAVVFDTTEPAFDGRPLELEVDMNSYLDTGLFLDHRVTRQLVGRMAAEQAAAGAAPRFLNLFAYTGSATVHAAAAGAAQTVTVDLSQTYLEWAARNMAANGFAGVFRDPARDGAGAGAVAGAGAGAPSAVPHTFERADTLDWLAAAARAGRRFDLVFVDPPTFSNSKAMGTRTWDVQRDHVALLTAVGGVMAPGAACVFSCNLRTFRPDTAALAAAGIALEDITAATIPEDWQRNPKIHKCYTFVKEG